MSNSTESDRITDKLWKFFASIKLSVVILLALAATSIIGTVIPQNASSNAYQEYYGEILYGIFTSLDLLDMYHSGWFQCLLLLLTINIVVCSINRLSSTWKIIFPETPVFNINQFKKSKYREEWDTNLPAESLKNMFAPHLSKRFSYSRVDTGNNGFLLFAEKRRWTHLGVYGVHFSILLLVVGSLIGSLFGFDGYVNIPVGESRNSIRLTNKNIAKELEFSIRCDDFNISLYDTGMPKEYRSSLSIISESQVVARKDIVVNDPLRYQGINIFQSSYGKTPEDRFIVIFTDKDSGVEYSKEGRGGVPIETPDGGASIIFDTYQDSLSLMNQTIENVFVCRFIDRSGNVQRIIIPVNLPQFDRMRNGKYVISVAEVVLKYYTGLQMSKDPGVPVVYAGFILMIIGCFITFFMYHEKVCIELIQVSKSSRVIVSGRSLKERSGMQTEIKQLAKGLKEIEERYKKESL